jgi:hypothetical protein
MPTLAPGINRPGRRVNRPPPSSTDVKETPLSLHGLLYGEIYLYFYLYHKIGSDRFFGWHFQFLINNQPAAGRYTTH